MWKSEGAKSLGLVALVAALAGLMAVPADCQPWPPWKLDNEVKFVIAGNDPNQEIRITDRGRGTALCREAGPGCSNRITWTWTNANAHQDKKLVIEYMKGTPDARLCFEKDRYELQYSGGGNHAEVYADVQSRCPEKSAWIYRVRCELVNGGDCLGIEDIDPGVVIER